jgi:hypothetical protein
MTRSKTRKPVTPAALVITPAVAEMIHAEIFSITDGLERRFEDGEFDEVIKRADLLAALARAMKAYETQETVP